jgi:hypothetical protein
MRPCKVATAAITSLAVLPLPTCIPRVPPLALSCHPTTATLPVPRSAEGLPCSQERTRAGRPGAQRPRCAACCSELRMRFAALAESAAMPTPGCCHPVLERRRHTSGNVHRKNDPGGEPELRRRFPAPPAAEGTQIATAAALR